MKDKEKTPTPQSRGTSNGANLAGGWSVGTAQNSFANPTQSTETEKKPTKEKERDPNLVEYLGTHILRGDAYLEPTNNVNTAIYLNSWLGYHQEVTQSVNTNWLVGTVGTPRYYRTLYTTLYSPTGIACVRKIVKTAVGNGLEFKTAVGGNSKNAIYIRELEKVLEKILYSLLIFGDSYTYQNSEGFLDFWSLDILRINTKGGTRAVQAGIVKRTFANSTMFAEPDFPTAIHPFTDNVGSAGWNTVYRVKNDSSTGMPWPLPERVAVELPQRAEYSAYAAGYMQFVRGVPPRFVYTVNGESVSSPEFKEICEYVERKSSGLAAGTSIAVLPGSMTENGSLAVLNNPDIPSYKEHKVELRDTILAEWGLTPFLAGFATAGSLGSTKERNAEYVNFVENTIKPLRRQLEMDIIQPYFRYCDAFLGTTLLKNYLGFIETNTLNLTEYVDVNKVLTVNEMRAALGKGRIEVEGADIPMGLLDIQKQQQLLAEIGLANNLGDGGLAPQTNTGA
jgi:hypothetical protein